MPLQPLSLLHWRSMSAWSQPDRVDSAVSPIPRLLKFQADEVCVISP